VVYDGAFTETALNTILTAGMLPVVKTPVYKTKRSQSVGTETVTGGTLAAAALFTVDGHPHINVVTVEGEKEAIPLISDRQGTRQES
jgi:hypothetical protein